MRLGLWALAALFIAAFAAHFLLEDQGYVLLSFRSYVIEMSVPALVVILVLGYAAIRGLVRLWRAPRQLGEALAGRGSRKAGERLTRGLMHMADGDWNRGERLLTQGLKSTTTPLVNYLLAARAAQQQGARERRNEWLKLASEALPEAEATVLLTQAELQQESGELEQALATLRALLEKHPEHRAGLALLAKTELALGDRRALVELLPRLARAKVPAPALAEIAVEALAALGGQSDLDDSTYAPLWSALPALVRQTPEVLGAHAHVLAKLGRGDQAAQEISAALKRNWDVALVRAYGEIESDDPLKQLRKAEDWLRAHAEDGALLLTAARLCMLNELWGKARSYLESSLALAPSPEAYALYGDLLERLGESDQAALAYHSGLSLTGGAAAPRLPALGGPVAEDRERKLAPTK